MRDPNRLDDFYEEFKNIHKENFPDWRFGQLISNFFGWIASAKERDIFFPEEEEMLKLFHEYVDSLKNNNLG